MAFNASWPGSWAFWRDVSPLAILAATVLQAFCTLMEWANHKRRWTPQYLGPLTLDVGSSYIALAPILAPVFTANLAKASDLATTCRGYRPHPRA